jgi:protein-tyrosine phosphatase
MSKQQKTIRILFVCMGNICRSPSAEAVMNAYIKDAGLSDAIKCDSAGTIGFHAGEPADSRMQKHAIKRNYNLTSISRQLNNSDFIEFDYVVGMDDDNMQNMQSFYPPEGVQAKIYRITDFCKNENPGYVPDPYYGGAAGFENVLDILEDACEGFLNHIKKEHEL